MNKLLKFAVPLGLLALSGCVVAPYGYGYRHGYYDRPRVIIAPPPVVVVRPYRY